MLIAVEDKGEKWFGRIRLKRVADASAKSLIPAVQATVAPASTVRTDDWSGYASVRSAGYAHAVVRKGGEPGESPLPLVHRVASLLKRWLLGPHQGAVRASHLDYYLDEYVFRFNRRTSRSRGKLFYRLVQQAAAIEPVIGQDIRGGTVL